MRKCMKLVLVVLSLALGGCGSDSQPSTAELVSAKSVIFQTGSFAPTSKIVMSNGTQKAISDIRVGDSVLISDGQIAVVYQTMIGLMNQPIIFDIRVDNLEILATGETPFFVDGEIKLVKDIGSTSKLSTVHGSSTVTVVMERPYNSSVIALGFKFKNAPSNGSGIQCNDFTIPIVSNNWWN